MEKIILVFYIGVGNMPRNEVEQYIQKIIETIRPKNEEEYIHYYIPIRDGETRIECINPKLVNEEEYKKAKEKLDEMKEEIDKYLENLKKEE